MWEYKEKQKRSIYITVLDERYKVIYDDYDYVPKTAEDVEILRSQTELILAEEKFTNSRFYPEYGFSLEYSETKYLEDATKTVLANKKATGQAAMHCIRQLKRNAVSRIASWNNARNSNVL